MVFTAPVLCVVVVAVLVGAVLQRLSGTGMGLVLAPTLTLVLGAATGVLVANATTAMSGLMLMYAMRANIEWRRVGLSCASALPGAFVGAVVVRSTSAAWLQVIVGSVVVLAIGVTVLADALGRMPVVKAPWVTPLAGFVGGIFNTTAGVAAPLLGKVNADVTAMLREPLVRERLAAQGLDPHGNSPAEFARYLWAEVAKWGGVVQVAGLTPQ